MADNKKYYYMRLKENFFDTDEMIYLESLEEGFLFSNILLKLYLRSLKNDGVLMMNEYVPYDAKMISRFTNQSLSTVEKALFEFKKLGLIEILDTGQMYMSNIELFVGKASTEADRKRIGRKKVESKLIENKEGGQNADKCPPELELELELEKKKDNTCQKFSTFDLEAAKLLEKLILQNNPKFKTKDINKWAETIRLMRERDERSEKDIVHVITWCQNDDFWCSNILSPDKLRKQFDRLYIAMNKNNKPRSVNNQYGALEAMVNQYKNEVNSIENGSTNNRLTISENNNTLF